MNAITHSLKGFPHHIVNAVKYNGTWIIGSASDEVGAKVKTCFADLTRNDGGLSNIENIIKALPCDERVTALLNKGLTADEMINAIGEWN